ncbi:MAG: DUF924 domain-containing protein [Gammaproteobacteria bacterium]|nr:DUF924 domain-containing protein [Gammaproteobacteria bacterium]
MERSDANDIPERALEVLEFWFKGREFDAPGLDARMKLWFGSDEAFDAEIRARFSGDIEHAARGEYRDWNASPRGRLALILVLDQFPRNVARGTAGAFVHDGKALALTLDGIRKGLDRGLPAVERAFFYMPLQHSENLRVQALGVKAFNGLTERVDETLRETFQTMAEFAELHHDIIERFGRFPHRNAVLGREPTPEEQAYLGDDAPSFGQ